MFMVKELTCNPKNRLTIVTHFAITNILQGDSDMARYVRPVYNVADVFAAACAAHRVNGGYVKYAEHDDEGNVVKQPNKYLIRDVLNGSFAILNEDRDLSEKVMQFCRSLTFKLLSDKRLSDFEASMLSIVEKETTDSNYDIAVASSLPASYERSLVRAEQNVRLREASGCIDADIGSKVELDIEVVRCNYSNEWGVFYVTAITDSGVVFFARSIKIEVGSKIRIRGKVKRHKEDRTQVSHVKLI